jgi:hypothetical protein
MPETRHWDTSQKFVLTNGHFDLAAELALRQETGPIFREIYGGAYRYVAYVEAEHSLAAQAEAHTLLLDVLKPYDVEVFVYDVRVVALREPKR